MRWSWWKILRIRFAGNEFPPFVGYGTVSTSWSFAVDVTKPRNRTRPRSFSVYEVYDCVRAGLSELDLPGMEVANRVFVNGRPGP